MIFDSRGNPIARNTKAPFRPDGEFEATFETDDIIVLVATVKVVGAQARKMAFRLKDTVNGIMLEPGLKVRLTQDGRDVMGGGKILEIDRDEGVAIVGSEDAEETAEAVS